MKRKMHKTKVVFLEIQWVSAIHKKQNIFFHKHSLGLNEISKKRNFRHHSLRMHPLFLTSFCGDQVLGRSVTPLRALLTGPSASLVPPKIPPISPSTSRFPSPTKQSEPGQMHQQWSDLARGRIYVVRRRCLIGWWCSNLTKCQSSVSDGKWTWFPFIQWGFFLSRYLSVLFV